jgi:hypothetical protein
MSGQILSYACCIDHNVLNTSCRSLSLCETKVWLMMQALGDFWHHYLIDVVMSQQQECLSWFMMVKSTSLELICFGVSRH